jgi:hypothetical protein
MPRIAKESRTKDEHIFPETKIRPLVLNWKRLIEEERPVEAMDLLEVIIVDSTEMFKRLAQHEKFHHTVPLDSLVVAAQEKVPKWLIKWDPAKGSLFSWLSTCAKNVFRSELVKTTTFTKRHHCTDDDAALERLSGFTDDGQDAKDKAEAVMSKLHGITCPWASIEMRSAIRFIIECVMEDDHRKQECIRGAAFAWGLSMETTKFLYIWATTEMRNELYDDKFMRFTDQDAFRAAYRNTPYPQMVDIVGWDRFQKWCAVHGGMRLRPPTIADLARIKQQAKIYLEIEQSDKDPESIMKIARRYNKTDKSATDIYMNMVDTMDPALNGDYPVYDDYPATSSHDEDEIT